jgi:hypothetical protein
MPHSIRHRHSRQQNIWFKDLLREDSSKNPSLWWWLLVAPGKVILWFAYMFPRGLGGVFGGTRRINSPIIQVWYSLLVYAFLVFLVAVGGGNWSCVKASIAAHLSSPVAQIWFCKQASSMHQQRCPQVRHRRVSICPEYCDDCWSTDYVSHFALQLL